jgi:hypothetical protein
VAAMLLNRITMPDRETFYREYVTQRRPVVITNLFEGQGIRDLDTLEKAKEVLGGVKLAVTREYTSASSGGSQSTNEILSFNDYWDLVEADPSTNLVCAEYEIPARLMTLFDLPPACWPQTFHSQEILDLPKKAGDFDLHENIFLANESNKAHLHYDGDQREVFLYQIFGRKDVALFQPWSGRFLRPLDRPFFSASGLYLDRMTKEQRLDLLDEANGYYGTLNPGDAVYMPSLIWHHLDYVDNAMSFNIRFGRNRYRRFLSVDNCHRDCYVQNFACRLVDEVAVRGSKYEGALEEIIAEYIKPAPSAIDKVRTMRRLFKDLCNRLCPEAKVDEYCPPDREEGEIEKIMDDIGHTMRYLDPRIVASSRPVGMISPVQRQQIESKAKNLGYSNEVLGQIAKNRIGKPTLGGFTKSDAAVFLNYLRAPGASLEMRH